VVIPGPLLGQQTLGVAKHRPVTRVPERPAGLWPEDDAASGWCLSSETAGLDIVGAEYVRDVEPGEIVILEAGHITDGEKDKQQNQNQQRPPGPAHAARLWRDEPDRANVSSGVGPSTRRSAHA
jgi:hypothetical protein